MQTILFLVLISVTSIWEQSIENKFSKAFDYISHKDTTKYVLLEAGESKYPFNIMISDSLVPMEFSSFVSEIAKEKGLDAGNSQESSRVLRILDSLQQEDKVNSFSPIYDEQLRELSQQSSNTFILFFSRPRENQLSAELFHVHGKEKSYNAIAQFNRSVLYLFDFNSRNQIEKVYVTTPRYN